MKIILIDENTHLALCRDTEYIKYVTDFKKDRHYIKPFELLGQEAKLELVDNTILKNYDPQNIKKNIEKNKHLFEFDAKNFEKYTFLLEEFLETEKLLKNTSEGNHE